MPPKSSGKSQRVFERGCWDCGNSITYEDLETYNIGTGDKYCERCDTMRQSHPGLAEYITDLVEHLLYEKGLQP